MDSVVLNKQLMKIGWKRGEKEKKGRFGQTTLYILMRLSINKTDFLKKIKAIETNSLQL